MKMNGDDDVVETVCCYCASNQRRERYFHFGLPAIFIVHIISAAAIESGSPPSLLLLLSSLPLELSISSPPLTRIQLVEAIDKSSWCLHRQQLAVRLLADLLRLDIPRRRQRRGAMRIRACC